jgi:hypothetical protein
MRYRTVRSFDTSGLKDLWCLTCFSNTQRERERDVTDPYSTRAHAQTDDRDAGTVPVVHQPLKDTVLTFFSNTGKIRDVAAPR